MWKNILEQFRKLYNRYKRIGYSLDIMRQTACLVINPVIVDGYALLFNFHDGGSGLRLNDGLFIKLFPVGESLTICLWLRPPWFNYWFSFHYENTPIQIYWKFIGKQNNFQIKNSDIFHIPAQNIDWGYSLEPHRRCGSNEYPQSMFFNK